MANYTIDELYNTTYNAISKARNDVSMFVKEAGFRTLAVNDKSSESLFWNRIYMIKVIFRLLSLNDNDTVFLQTSLAFLKKIQVIKQIKKFRIVYLIHDMYSLKYSEQSSKHAHAQQISSDMHILSNCDFVIAHNDIMKKRIEDNGCTSNIVSLEIFDYFTKYSCKTREYPINNEWTIAFAGNTTKSPFLKFLDKSKHNYSFNVYGGPIVHFDNLNYLGLVNPDELPSIISGHFGLIWEGDENIVKEDNYTCLNNPHKMSMYIVSGMPIITWDKSAAAKFVLSKECGIVVSKIEDIEENLRLLTPEKYSTMVSNCMKIRQDLINGLYIKRALKCCLNKM